VTKDERPWCLTCKLDIHHDGMSRKGCFCLCWKKPLRGFPENTGRYVML